MKKAKKAAALMMTLGLLFTAPVFADDEEKLEKAKDLVDRIRESDPPQSSSSSDTVKDRCDEANRQAKEEDRERAQKYSHTKEPPPPQK